MANIADVLNPEDIASIDDLAGGVTAANILHGSANPIGGQTIVIKLRWGKPASDLPFEGALPGIKFALGENPKRSGFTPPPGIPPRYPATRLGVEEVIRQAFIEATRIQKAVGRLQHPQSSRRTNLIPPRRNEQLEPLVEVMEGKRYVHAHCYRADEILMLMRVANEFGFKVRTFQHVLEGYKIADEIAASGAGGSTFSDWWGYKVEAYDAIPYNAALMTERGVVVSINSDDAQEARQLNQEAAKSMKYGGMSANDALKLITINPAIQLGIDQRVGSIEVGKDADLAIYNHDPLSVYAVVQKTLIDGQVYFDRQKDSAGRAALAKEKQDLLDKEKKAAEEKKDEDKEKPRTKTRTSPTRKRRQTRKRNRRKTIAVAQNTLSGRCAVNLHTDTSSASGTLASCCCRLSFDGLWAQTANAQRLPTRSKAEKFSRSPEPQLKMATVVIRDGKIAAVGANIAIPSTRK